MGPNLSIKALPAIEETGRLMQSLDRTIAARYAALSLTLKHAPKFLLPSIQAGERRGNLLAFDSDWSVFEDTAVPPFDSFVIEYQVVDNRDHDDWEALDVAPDRIIACWTDRDDADVAMLRIASIYTYSTLRRWQVCPLVASVRLGQGRPFSHLSFKQGRIAVAAHLTNEFLTDEVFNGIGETAQSNVRNEIGEELLHVYEMLIVSNTDNSTVRTEEPPAKLNRKRAAKGKPLLQTYHVLDVPYRSTKGPAQGGTHASPRFHLRRGHIRRLPEGRTTWVRPSAVGDPSRGTVKSDYRVQPAF